MVFHRAENYVPLVWPAAPGQQRTMMDLDI